MNRTYLLLGNAVSLAAACFTFAGSWSRDRKRIYLYHAGQCLLSSVANLILRSISGATTLALCSLRNTLLAYDRLTKPLCCLIVLLISVFGAASNNRGLLGLFPVVATAVYSVACLYARRIKIIKLNILVNLSLWAVYDFFIMDFVACAVDGASAALALLSLFRKPPSQEGQVRV